jgi:tyrosyl-tRNA synthetase
MYRTSDIQLQIGGADQYGNILSGVDAIKHASKAVFHEEGTQQQKYDPLTTPMGFTVPLLTTPSGEKFGKSAGNAVWLDKEQTSVFDLYGVRNTRNFNLQNANRCLVFRQPIRR